MNNRRKSTPLDPAYAKASLVVKCTSYGELKLKQNSVPSHWTSRYGLDGDPIDARALSTSSLISDITLR